MDIEASGLVLAQGWRPNNINFAVPSQNNLKNAASAYKLDAENPVILEISLGTFAAATTNKEVKISIDRMKLIRWRGLVWPWGISYIGREKVEAWGRDCWYQGEPDDYWKCITDIKTRWKTHWWKCRKPWATQKKLADNHEPHEFTFSRTEWDGCKLETASFAVDEVCYQWWLEGQ